MDARSLPQNLKRKTPLDIFFADKEKSIKAELVIPPDSYVAGEQIVNLDFPKSAIIAMIIRDEKYITPNGSTTIEVGDLLIILSNSVSALDKIKENFGIRE